MSAGRSLLLVALASLSLSACGHVVALDEAQFGPEAYVIECQDEAQCRARMARVCPAGYEGLNPGLVGVGAVLAADVTTEALVRGPARAVGIDIPSPNRRYIRCES